jgi:predicted  nucleic acid-binding Zn-ribbon protein
MEKDVVTILGVAAFMIVALFFLVWYLLSKYLHKIETTIEDVSGLKVKVDSLEKFRDDLQDTLSDISHQISKLAEQSATVSGILDIKDCLRRLHDRIDTTFKLLQENRESIIAISTRCNYAHKDDDK